MDKGTRVRIVGGNAKGQTGQVFWSGPSKYGGGLRLGVRTDAGDKLWLSTGQVEPEGGDAAQEVSYPFRFYGHGCNGDWIEGADDGHCFTVQFLRAPDEDELFLLGESFTQSLAKGPARPGRQPWEWSGRWALFHVGQRGMSRGPDIVNAVERFLMQAHELVPLVDVAYFNAAAGTDGWDEWSMQQGGPDPGPFLINPIGLFPRPHDPSLPRSGTCDVFEKGRRAPIEAKERKKLQEALARQGQKKKLRIEPVDPAAVPPDIEPFEWSTEDLAGFDVPEVQVQVVALPGGVTRKEWQVGDHPLGDLPVRPLAWVVAEVGKAASNLAWLDDDGQRTVLQKWSPAVSSSLFGQVVVHPSGEHAVVEVRRTKYLQQVGTDLYRLDFETRRARRIYTVDPEQDGGLGRVVFVLDGARLAVSTGKRLFLMDTVAESPSPMAPVKQPGGALVTALDGRALLAQSSRSWKLYGVAPDQLKNLGTVTPLVHHDREADGRLFFTGGGEHYELVGAQEAVERFQARVVRG